MTTILTGPQKAAVALANMDPKVAPDVLKHLSETEVEVISAEIISMRHLSAEDTAKALRDYNNILAGHLPPSRGGQDLAKRLLEASFGAEKAEGLLGRVSASMSNTTLDFLNAADPGQLAALIENEMPQTIALILARLNSHNAAQVLAALPDEGRAAVSRAIATMGAPTQDAITVISDALRSRTGVFSNRDRREATGGVQSLVDIINRSDAHVEKELLASLDASDPELAEEVRSRMVTFADVVRLDAQDVQRVLRGIDMRVLALALKNAPDQIADVLTANISQRNREALAEETRLLGAVRVKQVEEARAEIVQIVRAMSSAGEITFNRDDEDAIIA